MCKGDSNVNKSKGSDNIVLQIREYQEAVRDIRKEFSTGTVVLPSVPTVISGASTVNEFIEEIKKIQVEGFIVKPVTGFPTMYMESNYRGYILEVLDESKADAVDEDDDLRYLLMDTILRYSISESMWSRIKVLSEAQEGDELVTIYPKLDVDNVVVVEKSREADESSVGLNVRNSKGELQKDVLGNTYLKIN